MIVTHAPTSNSKAIKAADEMLEVANAYGGKPRRRSIMKRLIQWLIRRRAAAARWRRTRPRETALGIRISRVTGRNNLLRDLAAAPDSLPRMGNARGAPPPPPANPNHTPDGGPMPCKNTRTRPPSRSRREKQKIQREGVPNDPLLSRGARGALPATNAGHTPATKWNSTPRRPGAGPPRGASNCS
jgi:hypothetical protein